MLEEPKLIQGGEYKDERGLLQFVNTFDTSKIKRVYFASNANTKIIRAWQGHKSECRWFMCVRGSFLLKIVSLENFDDDNENSKPVFEYKLKEDNTQILFIPNGYANGFQALEEESKLMVFSDYLLGESEDDNYKFDISKHKW